MLPFTLPGERCLACDVCCRFNEAGSLMAPVFSAEEMDAAERAGLAPSAFCRTGYGRSEPILLEPGRDHAICPAFDENANTCRIYETRPLDCAIYPFVLSFDERGASVYLGGDLACPFVVDNLCSAAFRDHAQTLARRLDASLTPDLNRDSRFIAWHRPEFEALAPLPAMSAAVCRSDLRLARLTPETAAEMQHYFDDQPGDASHHAMAPIFAWTDLFNIYYRETGDRLLLFGEDGGGAFLWLPPVGRGPMGPALAEAVAILRELGRDETSCRIDNVAEDQVPALTAAGPVANERTEEFVYVRDRLIALSGRSLHGKRAACNHFAKHHPDATFEPFRDEDIPEALALYRRWAAGRTALHADAFYGAQIEASMLMHYRVMRHAGTLDLVGRALRADGRLVGYTFGFPLRGTDTAVILVEVADLAVRGAAATVFRAFARTWDSAARINTMGDSGLPNLRRAKMLYGPDRLVPVYTVRPTSEVCLASDV